jgi:quercetin dioxygenase-like cupin family protein
LTARGASSSYPTLETSGHAVYRIGPGLLLVFKPRGHRESEHAHPHRQRLRVLRGALRVETARRVVTLDHPDAPLTLAPGRRHATEAVTDTWLVAETLAPRR